MQYTEFRPIMFRQLCFLSVGVGDGGERYPPVRCGSCGCGGLVGFSGALEVSVEVFGFSCFEVGSDGLFELVDGRGDEVGSGSRITVDDKERENDGKDVGNFEETDELDSREVLLSAVEK